MTRGGARNRSGPRPDEWSARSDRSGFSLSVLPAEGHSGKAPAFPLTGPSPREQELWAAIWRLPQAAAWSRPSEGWRLFTIGMYVRQLVRCEQPDVGAAHLAQLHRFADQIGMTTAGLAEMGWKVAGPPEDPKPARPTRRRPSSRDRFPVVTDVRDRFSSDERQLRAVEDDDESPEGA